VITDTVKSYALGGVAVMLGLSIIGNVLLFRDRDQIKASLATTEQSLKTSREAGEQCSTSVTRLESEALEAAKVHKKAIVDAVEFERKRQAKARTILSTPATRPGDDCGSAKDRALNWLKGTP